MRTALVIGGGIGGLTAAIALRRAGWRVELFEGQVNIREVGAGITVQANAMAALATLGLAGTVEAEGHRFEIGFLGDMSARMLMEYPLTDIHDQLPHPSVAIGRPRLLQLLQHELPAESIHCGKRCEAVEQVGDEVVARFADGTRARGAIAVGADGIHSAVRASLWGPAPLRYAGYTCWRGVVPMGRLWDWRRSGEHWGRGTRFGCVPLGVDTLYWFAVATAPQGERFGDTKAACAERFADWHPSLRAIIDATPLDAILHNDIVDCPPADIWGRGRITLLGDAIHSTTPNMGQGACMAIESAVVLANRLRGAEDAEGALRSYEDARKARTRGVTQQSWRIGVVGHWEHPVAAALRDWGVWATPASLATREALKLWRFSDPWP